MPSNVVDAIINSLNEQADTTIAANRARFFKTGPGEYGEGDRFRGLTVPQVRSVVRIFKHDASLEDALTLLRSEYHEDRLLALLLMNELFNSGGHRDRVAVYESYLSNTPLINNWDLVDSSARFIVAPFIEDGDRSILYRLARSENLWERRIAVTATYHFIHHDDFDDILKLAELLLTDDEDLIHKAVGWMLREAGKRNHDILTDFLDSFSDRMPRTMLRYAIEKLEPAERKLYLTRQSA